MLNPDRFSVGVTLCLLWNVFCGGSNPSPYEYRTDGFSAKFARLSRFFLYSFLALIPFFEFGTVWCGGAF